MCSHIFGMAVAYGSPVLPIYKKAWEPYHCSFHLLRPSHCPPSLNEQTAEASRGICVCQHRNARALQYWLNKHIHKASTICFILDEGFESCEVSTSQERASSKRFQLCLFCSPTHICPWPGLCCAVCICKISNYLQIAKIMYLMKTFSQEI